MAWTLASNFSDHGAVAGLLLGTLLYLVSLGVALVVAKRPLRPEAGFAIVWGILYPFAQLWLVFSETDPILGLPLLTFGVPTAVSAGLLGWATRSWIPVAGCALGLGATAALSGLVWLSPWVAVPWNVCCGASLLVWAVRARRAVVRRGCCAACGYDLRGLPGRVCPECGGAGIGRQEGSGI